MQERAELHKTIWKIANDLRGAVDGWEFKAYNAQRQHPRVEGIAAVPTQAGAGED